MSITVRLHRGDCQNQIGQESTASDGYYSFTDLLPDNYCLEEVQPSWLHFSSTPDQVVMALSGGQYRCSLAIGEGVRFGCTGPSQR